MSAGFERSWQETRSTRSRTASASRPLTSIQLIVRSFFGDDDVVDVALFVAGGGYAEKARFRLELFDARRAAVPHSGPKTADQLLHDAREASLVRDPPLDPFRDKLRGVHLLLEVPILGRVAHRAERAHAPVGLERAALVENRFARAFRGSREEAPDHDRLRSDREGLHDVAAVLDTAVRDDGNAVARRNLGAVQDGGNLRDARARDHARGANGARAHSHFHAVG